MTDTRTAAAYELNPGDRIGYGIHGTSVARVVEVREPAHAVAAAVGLLTLELDVEVRTGPHARHTPTLVRIVRTVDPTRRYRLL